MTDYDQFPTVQGRWYFTVDCPDTGRVIIFQEDPNHGLAPFPPGPFLVNCPYCRGIHEIPDPVVTSHPAGRREA